MHVVMATAALRCRLGRLLPIACTTTTELAAPGLKDVGSGPQTVGIGEMVTG